MISKELTRRGFLQGTSGAVASVLMKAGVPALAAVSQAACTARDEGAAFETITNDEAREIIALAARILPTTDTPGATEAGAVYFFDQALGSFFADQLEWGRGLMAEFQSGIAGAYPGAGRFSDLDEADQDAYLKANEQTPFSRAFASSRSWVFFACPNTAATATTSAGSSSAWTARRTPGSILSVITTPNT